MNFVAFVEVSSMVLETVIAALVKTLKDGYTHFDIKKLVLLVLDGNNSILDKTNHVQQCIRDYAQHAIYKNYCCHRFALCINYLTH